MHKAAKSSFLAEPHIYALFRSFFIQNYESKRINTKQNNFSCSKGIHVRTTIHCAGYEMQCYACFDALPPMQPGQEQARKFIGIGLDVCRKKYYYIAQRKSTKSATDK